MKIALDFSALDLLPGTGQFRYVVDLIQGLSRIGPSADLLLLGSLAEPEKQAQAAMAGGRWQYRQFSASRMRGGYYLDHARMAALLWREQVDVLHAPHTFIPAWSSCAVVNTVHDLMFELFDEYRAAVITRPYRLHRWGVRQRCARAIAISHATAADLTRLWGVPAERIDVIHHGTRLSGDAAANGSKWRVRPEAPVICSAYNLEPRKNLTALLQAAAILRKQWPELRLVLFGRAAVTPERERRYEEEAAQLGLGEMIIRTGYLSDEDLRGLYRNSDVFAFPSLYEGFGLPILEAMACGTPVVARRASAMAEVVGDCGLLVETQNAGEIASAIDRLLRSRTLRADLSSSARQRAATFTIERMAEDTWGSYLRAAGRPAPAPSPDRARVQTRTAGE